MSASTKDIQQSILDSAYKGDEKPIARKPTTRGKPIGDPQAGAYVSDRPEEPDRDPQGGGGTINRKHEHAAPDEEGDAPIGGMR